ncbi:hypothetical protein ACT3UD_06545 [Glutamicibacter sp. 287]|uniref:hypothetical protein n=1 Tax=unclassified Glutamicibacter TaxID=2627139 RepID=UPI004033A690
MAPATSQDLFHGILFGLGYRQGVFFLHADLGGHILAPEGFIFRHPLGRVLAPFWRFADAEEAISFNGSLANVCRYGWGSFWPPEIHAFFSAAT